MKKKNILLAATAVLVLAAAISIYLFSRPELLGNMNNLCPEPTTVNSEILFTGTSGDKIKFSFRSDIQSGDLTILLYDSDGNVVYDLGKAKALECFFILEKTDTYTLSAQCSRFVGNYNIKVYDAD